MLKNTFCHVPGIGPKTERGLWDAGLLSWDMLLADTDAEIKMSKKRRELLTHHARESVSKLKKRDAAYFDELIPSNQNWRLFEEFQDSVVYLDIETTGLHGGEDHITTIALYDGRSIYTFVRGKNLLDFAECMEQYELIITYNGKCFDIPFIRDDMRVTLNQAHIDLRYVLASLGHSGGLKACEKRFGLEREGLEDIDGYFAVLLWNEYLRNRNELALDTLLAYNIADVLNLAGLMPLAYNMKIQDTPFSGDVLPLGELPEIPFDPDARTISRIRRAHGW